MTEVVWVRTDQRIEAVRALEMFRLALGLVDIDPYYWKWAIIALHNALQAFIVCAISGTAGLGALKPRIIKKWLKVYELGSKSFPERKLDWFPELYERMKNQFNFKPPVGVDKSVDYLNTFRNEFVHFTPKSWSLLANGLPQMAKECLEVINFLGWESARVLWDKEDRKHEARKHYMAALDLLENLQQQYGG